MKTLPAQQDSCMTLSSKCFIFQLSAKYANRPQSPADWVSKLENFVGKRNTPAETPGESDLTNVCFCHIVGVIDPPFMLQSARQNCKTASVEMSTNPDSHRNPLKGSMVYVPEKETLHGTSRSHIPPFTGSWENHLLKKCFGKGYVIVPRRLCHISLPIMSMCNELHFIPFPSGFSMCCFVKVAIFVPIKLKSSSSPQDKNHSNQTVGESIQISY